MSRIGDAKLKTAGMLWASGLMALAGCNAVGGGGGGGGAAGSTPSNSNGGSVNGIVADAGAGEQTVSLDAGQFAAVTLDAGGSTSANGSIVNYQWTERDCGEIATGQTAEVMLGAGEHEITLTVTDSSGALDTTMLVITVVDNRPSIVTLTTAVQGSGTVAPPSGSPVNFDLDSTTTVTATPDAGFRFVRWSGDSQAATAAIDVIMNGSKSITATFEQIPAGGVPRFHLPWAAHQTRTTGQANGGEFSHQDRFAWDYSGDIGTPIVAVAAGRVIRVIDDVPNNEEGATPSPDDPANAVQIDHGDGLQSLYAHMDQFGVAVMPGQRVVAGQYLGRTGNSGFTTGPHVHYEILDPSGNSMPSGFLEAPGDGISEEGDPITSQNTLAPDSLDGYAESTLPTDAFSENNIELIAPTPPAFFFTTGVTYTARGRVTDQANNVCVALVDLDNGDTVFCEPRLVGINDQFEIDFTFPADLTGNYLLGVVSGTGGVSGLAPVTVLVSPPDGANSRPTVSVQQPADNTIAFGDTGTLSG
ncbi:MAG: peptidoglycan DD-metalloendopeptidase family protein, partial [Phycisphaerae bacterium]